MSLRDRYDGRFFLNGQEIGVTYGGSVHQPKITYSNIANPWTEGLPDPGPLYGESRPPIIFDNTNLFNRAPRYGGGFNVPGAAGNLAMSIAANYLNPALSFDTRNQEAFFQQQQNKPQAPGFDPENLHVQPKIQPGDPGWNPFLLEQDRDRFILNNPRSGVAEMPRYIRGSYAPRGAIIKAPHLDSPYMDEQIRRGFVPMTPPVRRPGPQLPGFV